MFQSLNEHTPSAKQLTHTHAHTTWFWASAPSWRHAAEETKSDAAGIATSCATPSTACFSRGRRSRRRKTSKSAANWWRLLSVAVWIGRWNTWTWLRASNVELHQSGQKGTLPSGFPKRQEPDKGFAPRQDVSRASPSHKRFYKVRRTRQTRRISQNKRCISLSFSSWMTLNLFSWQLQV